MGRKWGEGRRGRCSIFWGETVGVHRIAITDQVRRSYDQSVGREAHGLRICPGEQLVGMR